MKYKASRIALLGLFFALSMVLSLIESSFSAYVPVPGVKLGLSNIVTMYCLFCLGRKEAYTLSVLKAFFVLLTRGAVAAAMSLSGGLVSITAMLLVFWLCRRKSSYVFISVCGGVFHNAGQLLIASALLQTSAVFYYFPILAVSGVGMGIMTGILLRYLMPHFNRIFF